MKKIFIILISFSLLQSQSLQKIDEDLFKSINNSQSKFKNSIFHTVDDSFWPTALSSPIIIYGVGLKKENQYLKETAVLLTICQMTSYLEKSFLKSSLKRDRPFVKLDNVNTYNSKNLDKYSFPSGHATAAFTFATILSLRYPQKEVVIPTYLWASLVSIGRVYNGVHYPSDVLAGAIIGTATSFLVFENEKKVLKLISFPENVFINLIPNYDGAKLNFKIDF